jgi:hypothetical protein
MTFDPSKLTDIPEEHTNTSFDPSKLTEVDDPDSTYHQYIEPTLVNLPQGALIGGGDELVGGVQAVGEAIKKGSLSDFLDDYRKHQKENEAYVNELHERSPWVSGIAQAAGGLATGLLTAGSVSALAAPEAIGAAASVVPEGMLATQAAARLGTLVGEGALGGGLSSKHTLGEAGDLAQDVAIGGAIGGIAGVTIPRAIAGASKYYKSLTGEAAPVVEKLLEAPAKTVNELELEKLSGKKFIDDLHNATTAIPDAYPEIAKDAALSGIVSRNYNTALENTVNQVDAGGNVTLGKVTNKVVDTAAESFFGQKKITDQGYKTVLGSFEGEVPLVIQKEGQETYDLVDKIMKLQKDSRGQEASSKTFSKTKEYLTKEIENDLSGVKDIHKDILLASDQNTKNELLKKSTSLQNKIESIIPSLETAPSLKDPSVFKEVQTELSNRILPAARRSGNYSHDLHSELVDITSDMRSHLKDVVPGYEKVSNASKSWYDEFKLVAGKGYDKFTTNEERLDAFKEGLRRISKSANTVGDDVAAAEYQTLLGSNKGRVGDIESALTSKSNPSSVAEQDMAARTTRGVPRVQKVTGELNGILPEEQLAKLKTLDYGKELDILPRLQRLNKSAKEVHGIDAPTKSITGLADKAVFGNAQTGVARLGDKVARNKGVIGKTVNAVKFLTSADDNAMKSMVIPMLRKSGSTSLTKIADNLEHAIETGSHDIRNKSLFILQQNPEFRQLYDKIPGTTDQNGQSE